MAIITPTSWQAYRGTAVTGDDLTSAGAICAAVDAAIRREIAPFEPEPLILTDRILDAPIGHVLELPVLPVRSVTSVYLHWGANGDPSAFTSDDLLTAYTDYYLPVDDHVRDYSRSGLVFRRGASTWGYEYRRPYNRLAWDVDPNRGAVKVTFLAGPTSVPDDLFGVAAQAVTMLFNRRTTGTPTTSEGWNGYSASYAAPFLVSFLQSPDVQSVLTYYRPPARVAAGAG